VYKILYLESSKSILSTVVQNDTNSLLSLENCIQFELRITIFRNID